MKCGQICMWRRSQLCFNCGSSLTPLFASKVGCMWSLECQLSPKLHCYVFLFVCMTESLWFMLLILFFIKMWKNNQYDIRGIFCKRWNRNDGVVMLKHPELHFLSHPKLLSLSWEWTQEVELSMATTEEWYCLLPQFLLLLFIEAPHYIVIINLNRFTTLPLHFTFIYCTYCFKNCYTSVYILGLSVD